MIKTICINCGSASGKDPEYMLQAQKTGRYLAQNKIDLVYGGSSIGLMGAVACTAMDNGGKVYGVIPRFIHARVGQQRLTKIYVVDTMHERKQKMFEMSDAFIALPGGFGTMEEILEIITWAQLGFHRKPFGFLNVHGYYDKLFDFFKFAVREKFVKSVHNDMIIADRSIDRLVRKLNRARLPKVHKWFDSDMKNSQCL